MAMVNKLVAVYLILTALAVAALLIITPLIHDGSDSYPLWEILNYFMAVGVVIVLVANYICKRRQDASDQSDLAGSLVFYGAVALTMLFFWEWFWTLNPDSETGNAAISHTVYFPLVDALYTVLALTTGRELWRASEG
ncbi:MAG: hypothetical protein OXN15_08570 [Chloroflexota bacterium]|nr:hypothetical protein [Chloroflexota bacterium]MDE2969590.1 hypothetical protein [Chloroflexota bacterium]